MFPTDGIKQQKQKQNKTQTTPNSQAIQRKSG